MPVTKAKFSQYIRAFQFRELFNDMGWNNDRTKQPIVVDETIYNLSGIGEKSGFRIFTCVPADGKKSPDNATRKKIEGKVTKLFHEHLIIFIDEHKKDQVWQLAIRKAGSTVKISETRYHIIQDPELLYQRTAGLFFTLDDEEKVTIVDVTKRVADNFQQNNEKVTKKFYESFKKEHTAFLKFIKGIDDKMNMDWYASLMLNRLMFCYFIQKKGFLDNNKNYLQDKLKACKEKRGKNKFYSFYRDFLIALFHKGLGSPQHEKKLEVEIGRVPYLNGGLFDEHEIEKTHHEIQIDDKAFEKLFDFFDEYEWHLDTRESASGRDINPDVIGYIFEKYINDRAQMGAYYTKEDITDYISKNCVVPWLFDEVKRNYPKAFKPDGWLWKMVKASEDAYIYDAVKKGVPESGDIFGDLPEEIRKGFNPTLEKKVVDGDGLYLHELRKEWNKPAPSDIALPTEIYREAIERRKRYADVKSKITNGEINDINDFITFNLDIRQFALDVIVTTDDSDFIRHFYKALTNITILDPTCGSGAFLFAAMNILEELYEACIRRMQNFVNESHKGKHEFFEKALKQVNASGHPNLQYFIYKSIILNNLYGVDIMNEAVEIAKLRLFLKLVATVDVDYKKPNLGLEPLPDVDFNIRAGNTLVGYTTEQQLEDAFYDKIDFDNDAKKIKEKCDIISLAYTRYKDIQLTGNADYKEFTVAKNRLNNRLLKLTNELNLLLHKQHYLNVKFDNWLSTHRPFHWFAEFYGIIKEHDGFDVIIGNPPYIEYSKVRKEYTIKNYLTESSGNLYAYAIEKSNILLKQRGRFGFIIPISFVCTQRMRAAQEIILQNSRNVFLSNYAERPSKLFTGAEVLLTIILSRKEKCANLKIFSSGFTKWSTEERPYLFERTNYSSANRLASYIIPKVSSSIETILLDKIKSKSSKLGILFRKISPHIIYYRIGGGRYWKIFTNFQPKFILNGKNSISSRENYLYFDDEVYRDCSIAILSSSHFYWYFILSTNCRDLNPSDLTELPLSPSGLNQKIIQGISKLSANLMGDYQNFSQIKEKTSSLTGEIKYQEFYPRLSKPLIDQIDCLLARYYGFTHEELDFIINYDIKYRMGKELEVDDNGQ